MLNVVNSHSVPIVCSNSEGIQFTTYQYSFPNRYEHAYKNELDHFLDCICDHSLQVKVSLKDVLLANRVINACIKSQNSKKAESLEPINI